MAASLRISYSATGIGGQHLAAAVRYSTLALQEIKRAKDIADSVSAGGVTPANLEGEATFNAAAAGGSALYTAISNLNTNLATVTAAQLAALDQG